MIDIELNYYSTRDDTFFLIGEEYEIKKIKNNKIIDPESHNVECSTLLNYDSEYLFIESRIKDKQLFSIGLKINKQLISDLKILVHALENDLKLFCNDEQL